MNVLSSIIPVQISVVIVVGIISTEKKNHNYFFQKTNKLIITFNSRTSSTLVNEFDISPSELLISDGRDLVSSRFPQLAKLLLFKSKFFIKKYDYLHSMNVRIDHINV